LQNTAKNFGMDISPEKSETMAFLGQDAVRCEIIVNNKHLQQQQNFNYLSCEISYENEKDNQQKLAEFAQMLGILNNIFKPTLVQKSSRIKVYNALTLLILLYGSENWTFRQKDKKRLISIETNFFKRTVEYTLSDHRRNEEILEELKLEPAEEKLRRYKSNWLQHVTRMNNTTPKIMLNY
jgi:hypothetical protein